jgi:D-aspartate ligase
MFAYLTDTRYCSPVSAVPCQGYTLLERLRRARSARYYILSQGQILHRAHFPLILRGIGWPGHEATYVFERRRDTVKGSRMIRDPKIGAVVIGGDHPGLAIARSLGRRGIPVYVIEDQQSISVLSRYVTRVVRVPDLRDEQKTVDSVLEVGHRFGLKGWVLFPTRDETVAAFSRHRARLAEFFRVTTPPWDTVRWAWDKNNTWKIAEELGIPSPRTWNVKSAEELPPLYPRLPLAVKPAVKEHFFYATGAKAWRADTPQQLQELFQRATREIKTDDIMLQEIIPGDGQQQLSYCAFFKNGRAHSTLLARRMRQHPREFGRAATYVETVDLPEIEELAERLLRAINFYGIVEVEFKQDPRDGQYKLLDINARAWGFHGLGRAAGVDFPYLLFADQFGEQLESSRAKAGLGWMRLVTDVPVATSDMLHGHLKLSSYWHSLRHTRTESVFYVKDPLPSLAELVLLPYLIAKKYSKKQK